MSSKFGLDYAKRVAKCKKCQQQLLKGDLRMWRMVPNPFTADSGNPTEMKNYFHIDCLFETLTRSRATTKVIDSPDDIEGWDVANDDDKASIIEKIRDLSELRLKKFGDKVKTSASKDTLKKAVAKDISSKKVKDEKVETVISARKKEKYKTAKKDSKEITSRKVGDSKTSVSTVKNEQSTAEILETSKTEDSIQKIGSKFDMFKLFCKLCDVIASVSKYTEKTEAVKIFINKEGYDGDLHLLLKFLIPEADQRIYNLKAKQIIKIFSTLFDWSIDELTESYNQTGDVSETICSFLLKFDGDRKKTKMTNQMVDEWLEKLSELTREKDQQSHFSKIRELVSCLELKYIIRLIMKDLRINAGAKHILEGLRKGAYEMFQHSRNLQTVIEKCQQTDKEELLESGIILNTPVKPMLAEPCRDVKQAMEKCSKEMYAEIKYDGERLQLHKDGSNFRFFSRSLKPALDHKVVDLNKVVSEAFPTSRDLIVDTEMLLIDTNTGKPLPFGTLGIHKKSSSRMRQSLRERRKFLEDNMKEVPNRVLLSNCNLIKKGETDKLEMLIWKAIDEGLEGLVLKDLDSVYEPGKRHWLKVKKDYLKGGDMADSADLVLLGAFYGTGNKGGTMSVFLMGVYDKEKRKFCTVTKCGNGHDDATLDRINKELEPKMHKISRVYENLPEWIDCSRSLVPDFIVIDPKESPVWEIAGAEFTRSDNHTASGISIRFPRVIKIRDDKNWETATSLQELERLFELSKPKTDIESTIDDTIPLYAASKNDAKDGKVLTARKRKRDAVTENPKNDEEVAADNVKEDGADSDEEVERKKAKIPCKYGAQCYRKNVEHRKQFEHPK
ncbi:DNA ligase [Loa loa]|uniref:DNA ligase (ATP) n=1 Tax=Loa loa TaxID=7209 RepID=A0A1S0UFH1_LOALO|nr:DNA ligase [Loa loa]EJD74156.1 DNA ligase [Loa loa]